MNNGLTLGQLVAVIIGIAAALMIGLGLYARYLRNDGIRALAEDARENVDEVLAQCGWETRQRWVDDTRIEFVYFILGKKTRDHHLMWARVHLEKKNLTVQIECAEDMHQDYLPFAEAIAAEFNARGIKSSVIRTHIQPRLDETGVEA